MNEFNFREATTEDIPFLVKTIIEAEKSGTNILTYSTIFGLTEPKAREYIAQMLLEEIDNCELSISSFLLAEIDNRLVAAVAAWIEGIDGVSSTILKGNLLRYVLPDECIQRAISLNHIIRELHIEYQKMTIQIGLVYVSNEYRGQNLASILIEKQIQNLTKINQNVDAVYVQVFGNNIAAIRAYEKAYFKIVLVKESIFDGILDYMPSNKKILMKRG